MNNSLELLACSMDILWRFVEGDNSFGQFNRRSEIDVDFLSFVTDLLVFEFELKYKEA